MAPKAETRQLAEQTLERLVQFLKPYLPLANAHNTDFITHKLWESHVHPSIAVELLQLTKQQVVAMLKQPSSGSDTRNEDVRTEDVKNIFPNCEKDVNFCTEIDVPCEVNYNSDTSLSTSTSHSLPSTKCKLNKLTPTFWNRVALCEYVQATKCHSLDNLGVLSTTDDLQLDTGGGQIFVKKFMSGKKCHEVELMADVCDRLAQSRSINYIVDVGSGKGYLSSSLALNYGYHVIGIDSCSSNTYSAKDRNTKITKHWKGLMRNAIAESSGPDAINIEVDEPRSTKAVTPCSYRPLTMFVDTTTDLRELVNTWSEDEAQRTRCGKTRVGYTRSVTSENKPQCTDRKQSEGACAHLEGDRKQSEGACAHLEGDTKFMLTGLHTCGNLASSLLHIFVMEASANVLCNVGCCYNHINEEFVCSPFTPVGSQVLEIGFPVSSILKKRKFFLGRNARMLACQSIERLPENGEKSHMSLYWRAVLQVILRDVTGELRDDWIVGRIASKCGSFLQYVRKAMGKLEIHSEKLSDEKIIEMERRYSDCQHKMACFFYLRAALAHCIEGIILLDKLCFLLEQENVESAHVLKLFDPATSPRCFSVIATKKERTPACCTGA